MFERVLKELIVRDPKPFDSCHASHLAILPGGEVLAVWFAGSREGADDVAIWSARRVDGEWTKPVTVADEPDSPHWNPVLFVRGDGRVILFYKVGRKIKDWYTKVKESKDGGRTWSQPRELVKGDRGGRGPVRNKAIVLSVGSWLAPASTEDGVWKAFTDRSADEGGSWTRSGDIAIPESSYAESRDVKSDVPVSLQSFAGRGVIQPTLWESEAGIVHMLLRSSEGRVYRSDSKDSGRTWSEPYATNIPNNNSGIDAVKLMNGMLLLLHNPVGENWGPRTPLVLRASRDNGGTWEDELILEQEPGEYSYPAIIAEGNDVYLTYTWKRVNIAFWKIRLETV